MSIHQFSSPDLSACPHLGLQGVAGAQPPDRVAAFWWLSSLHPQRLHQMRHISQRRQAPCGAPLAAHSRCPRGRVLCPVRVRAAAQVCLTQVLLPLVTALAGARDIPWSCPQSLVEPGVVAWRGLLTEGEAWGLSLAEETGLPSCSCCSLSLELPPQPGFSPLVIWA